jgi:biotin transport system substrate-specific component
MTPNAMDWTPRLLQIARGDARRTYADLLRPPSTFPAITYDVALILVGSWLIALSAQIAIPLPFTPVPVTGQTLTVLLLGMLMGARRGGAAVVAYLIQGAVGAPFFAGGGAGWPVLLGPTGGYLLGFIPAVLFTGYLARRGWDRHFVLSHLALLAGNSVIYLVGLPWLSLFIGRQQALSLGLVPFIPGDLIKIALAALILPLGWKLRRS